MSSGEAMRALREERGLSCETLGHFGITAEHGAWKIPVRVGGQEVGVRYKNFDSATQPKYWWPRREEDSRRFPVYNLDAAKGQSLVYLVAGEPDVWPMHQAGFPAVTFTTGEGVVPEEGLRLLREQGVRALLVPYDRDATGRKGAGCVAATAKAHGIEAIPLELPTEVGEKGDITDLWRVCQFDPERFKAAVITLPEASLPSFPIPAPIGTGIGNDLIRVWEQPEPSPRSWLLEGLIPEGAISILYGDGGVGKSMLALFLATCIAIGRGVLGRSITRCPALYIDGELDRDEFTRRGYRVARGMGLVRPPEGLHYWRLPGPVTHPDVQAAAKQILKESGAGLVVLDSLSVAAFGGTDVTEARDVVPLMQALTAWGTVVALDHIPKPQDGANLATVRPFGSTFKYNLARSVIQVAKADGEGLLLRQTKNNFGPLAHPLGLNLDFHGDAVRVESLEIGDARLAGIEDHLPAVEKVALTLAEYPGGVTPDVIAQELGSNPKTVRNHLTTLKRQVRAKPRGDGSWVVPTLPGAGEVGL